MRCCWPIQWWWHQIERVPLVWLDQTALQCLVQQLAIASTQLQHSGVSRRMGGDLAAEPAMIAHEKIDPAQIAARVKRIRMLGR